MYSVCGWYVSWRKQWAHEHIMCICGQRVFCSGYWQYGSDIMCGRIIHEQHRTKCMYSMSEWDDEQWI